MARKPAQTGDKVSSIAGKTLRGERPTLSEAQKMAASLLRQDQKRGPRGK
jgi:hypothetical protein